MRFTLKEIINYCTKINKRVAKGEDINEYADLIIKFEEPEFIYRFALYVKNAPVEKLADAIIKLANEEASSDTTIQCRSYPNLPYLRLFARDVKGAPIEKLADELCTFGVYGKNECINFAKEVKNAPIEQLSDNVIEIAHYEDLERLGKEVKNAPIDKITKRYLDKLELSEFNSGELANKILHFSKTVKQASVEELTKFIITHGTAEDIYKYALHEKKANIEKLANSVIKKGEILYIQLFARNIKNAPVGALADGLITKLHRKNKGFLPTGYPSRELYLFAKNVKNAPVEKLADEIIRMVEEYTDKKETNFLIEEYSKNFGYNAPSAPEIDNFPIKIVAKDIYDFALNVEGAPVEKLANAMMATNIPSAITKFAQNVPNAPKNKIMNYIQQLTNAM